MKLKEFGFQKSSTMFMLRKVGQNLMFTDLLTLMDCMNDDLYCFKANRLVSITMHKRKASNMFKMKCEKGNEDDINLHKVLNKIKAEIKQVPTLKNEYLLGDQEALSEMCISTLENLLALASPKFRNSKNSALSSNIASTAFSNHNKVP